MSTARRLSTNPDAVTARPGRAAVALALTVAALAAMPAAAEAQFDPPITIQFDRSERSVHEGDPLGISISFSEIPDRVILDQGNELWFVEIPLTLTPWGGARTYGIDYHTSGSVKVYRNRGRHYVGFGFFASEDDVVDPGEGVEIGFGSNLPNGFVVGEPSTVRVTILDGPSPPPVSTMVTLSVSRDSVSEDAGSTPVTVTGVLNSAAFDSDTSVTVYVDNGTAIAGTDFATVSDFTLTIPANETRGTATFNLVPTNDDVDESDETLLVMGRATGLTVDSATMTITDDDTASSKVTLSVNPTAVSEGAGPTTVTVTGRLDGAASTTDTSVTVSVGSGTATAGADFGTISNFPLTIPAESKRGTATFSLVPTDDNVAEGRETLTVSGNATGLTVDSTTLEITDNDAMPTVTLELSPTSISENGGVSTVTASLSGASSQDVTLNVSAAPLTGTVANDFRLSGNTTLTITAGQTESTGAVTVAAEDNTIDAPNKTVQVSAAVTAGPAGMTAPAARTLTITDDEGTPTVTLELSPTSMSENGGVSTVTASLSGASSQDVTLNVSAAPLTGTVTNDFRLSGNTTLTITAGQTESTGAVTVTAEDNAVHSGERTVRVTASVTTGPSGLTAPGPRTLTITDDEGPPTVTLDLSSTTIPETSGVSTVTATLNRATNETVTLTVSAAPVSPAESRDFTQTGTTLTIAVGSTTSTGTVTIAAENDAVDTPDKKITVSGAATAGPAGMSAPTDQTLTITDDEATPTVTLLLTPEEISENGGRSTVTARLTGESSEAVTVTVSTSPTTPAGFTQSGTTLTIAAGSTTSTGTVTIAAENNDVDAPNMQVTVSGSVSGGHGVSAPANQTLTITDDEATPTVTLVLTPAEISENEGQSVVTATLTGASSEDVTVTVSTSPASSADFTQAGTTLTIGAGSTTSTGTVTITARDNDVHAPDKTVTVSGSVSGGNGVSAPANQTLTITDNEVMPTVTLVLAPDEISENGGSSTGDGDAEPQVERRRDGDGNGFRGVAGGARGLHADRHDADDRRG